MDCTRESMGPVSSLTQLKEERESPTGTNVIRRAILLFILVSLSDFAGFAVRRSNERAKLEVPDSPEMKPLLMNERCLSFFISVVLKHVSGKTYRILQRDRHDSPHPRHCKRLTKSWGYSRVSPSSRSDSDCEPALSSGLAILLVEGGSPSRRRSSTVLGVLFRIFPKIRNDM